MVAIFNLAVFTVDNCVFQQNRIAVLNRFAVTFLKRAAYISGGGKRLFKRR